MKRFLAMLVATACLVGTSISFADPGSSYTGPHWKMLNLMVRRGGNALNGQTLNQVNDGYIDSAWVANGATGRIDTLAAFPITDLAYTATGALNDSAQFIRVEVVGKQAFASGESLYVTIDGWNGGDSFTVLGSAVCGTCASGGFSGAGSLVPGTTSGAGRNFLAKGNILTTAGGNVAAAGMGTTTNPFIYGGFFGYPGIRIRIRSDFATAPVAQSISYRIWYLSSAVLP